MVKLQHEHETVKENRPVTQPSEDRDVLLPPGALTVGGQLPSGTLTPGAQLSPDVQSSIPTTLREHQAPLIASTIVGTSSVDRLVVPLTVAALASIVFACFGRTLTSYFLADDFSEIWYVSEIFNGRIDFFWSTLFGNYMNVPGMSVWRPGLLASLICDYALWGTEARGYYLTNLLYFTGDVLLLYFVTRELLASWTRWRRELAAFFASALFAVSPLHCESISWVVGRVDTISCFYYLGGLLLMLLSRRHGGARKGLYTGFAVACFWIGLLTKEMAIGLPVIATLIFMLWPAKGTIAQSGGERSGNEQPRDKQPRDERLHRTRRNRLPILRERSLAAMRSTLPLWLSLLAYFPLRFLVLGTFVGGYVDGFGSAQLSAMVQKWLDPETIGRFLYPLNLSVFGTQSIYVQLLTACYIVAIGIVVVRALLMELPWKWLVLLLGWAVTAAVPIFQLWGLGENLEGSRFYFYLTIPASLLLPILLLSSRKNEEHIDSGSDSEESKVLHKLNIKLTFVAAVTMFVLTATLFGAAYKSNLVWVHAGNEVRAFWHCCKQLAANPSDGAKFLILGIPKEHHGAHQILNGPTFGIMLNAPFTATKLTRSFLTFDPIMYGAADRINDTRFKECLSMPGVKGPLIWNGTSKSFVEVPLTRERSSSFEIELFSGKNEPGKNEPGKNAQRLWQAHVRGQQTSSSGSPRQTCHVEGDALVLENVQPGDALVFNGLNLNPLDSDFLTFGIKYPASAGKPKVRARWNNDPSNLAETALIEPTATQVLELDPEQNFTTERIHLSHYWRWYSAGKIDRLEVELFPCERIEIRGVKLVSGSQLMPTIQVSGATSSPAGVYRFPESGMLELSVNSNIGGGSRVIELEISKPNFFFANFAADKQEVAVGKRVRLEPGATKFQLNSGTLPLSGFYEVRCRCLNNDGSPASEYSNPTVLSK